jgi:hypothetical protein
MAKFRNGQRIVKVHGHAIGSTGTATDREIPVLNRLYGRDLVVILDHCGLSLHGEPVVAGEAVACLESEWEPLLDRHTPCESEFKESLDKLLSDVRHASVE